MLRKTVTELANDLGVEYIVASNLIKLMESQGQAKKVETRPNPTGKGKGSAVYELQPQFSIDLTKKAA